MDLYITSYKFSDIIIHLHKPTFFNVSKDNKKLEFWNYNFTVFGFFYNSYLRDYCLSFTTNFKQNHNLSLSCWQSLSDSFTKSYFLSKNSWPILNYLTRNSFSNISFTKDYLFIESGLNFNKFLDNFLHLSDVTCNIFMRSFDRATHPDILFDLDYSVSSDLIGVSRDIMLVPIIDNLFRQYFFVLNNYDYIYCEIPIIK